MRIMGQIKPHWSVLLERVRELDGNLVALVNLHLGSNLMAKFAGKNTLPKATSSVASAWWLEETDSTHLIVATMRSILAKCGDSKNHVNDSCSVITR